MGYGPIAHVPGSSQDAGGKTPLHVMLLDEDGNALDFQGGSTVWGASHVPAANTQATATRAAAGAGIRNVCTGFTVTLAAQATDPAAIQLVVRVIDGASGTGTYLWQSVIAIPATAGAIAAIVRSSIYLPGTANTAMTVEFSAAGGANTIESVSMDGTTTV